MGETMFARLPVPPAEPKVVAFGADTHRSSRLEGKDAGQRPSPATDLATSLAESLKNGSLYTKFVMDICRLSQPAGP